jgi:transposase
MTNPTNDLFAAALGIAAPWFVDRVDFDTGQRKLTIHVDFKRGSRFRHPKAPGEHGVHDTEVKRLRHLNFFQHECYLEVRVPRVKLPDGRVALVDPDWVGKLSGFTLLFEALILMLAQQMPFAAVARTVGESWHRVHAICRRYVDLAVASADLSATSSVIIDETSYRRGHSYLTLVADADARKVVFVSKGRGADNIAGFAQHLRAHNAAAENITAACIDMSPAFIKGVTEHLPKAAITFDKFHVVAHASEAVDKMRRIGPCSRTEANGPATRPAISIASSSSSPQSGLPAPGFIANNCAISSIAGNSTSFPPCSLNGAPTSCAPRSNP